MEDQSFRISRGRDLCRAPGGDLGVHGGFRTGHGAGHRRIAQATRRPEITASLRDQNTNQPGYSVVK